MATVRPPLVAVLSAGSHFNALSPNQKLYAHHMCRAAWHGARIILRQVSPESEAIFDFILELHRNCNGDWNTIADKANVSMGEMRKFLDYAAVFLGNVGNYYGHGDQKFVPDVPMEFMERLSTVVPLDVVTREQMLSTTPAALGFAHKNGQTAYYLGETITEEEIKRIDDGLRRHEIYPENTRLRKVVENGEAHYDVLVASTLRGQHTSTPKPIKAEDPISLQRGDYCEVLERICAELDQATRFATSGTQATYLLQLKESFESGAMNVYKKSQETWIRDKRPPVETIFGFVEPYRDPYGVRAEFEGLVAVVDKEKTEQLVALGEAAGTFVKRLPWCGISNENEGRGPFEKPVFEEADFTSLHTIAYCSSIIFPGINLPNYNDIRQTVGSKSVMIANSLMQAVPESDAACIRNEDKKLYLEHKSHAFYLWVVFHELLGHGTGKLLSEESPGKYNFDLDHPPLNPITKKPISTWYTDGQTWTGVFGDLATTVDECRAECVGAYLLSDMELLSMFGYTDRSEITGKDLEYNMYLQLGVAGLNALKNYIVEDKKWGQAHSRAHLAIFRSLRAAGDNFLWIEQNNAAKQLTVHIDPSKIASHGRPALGRLLLQLHIYRCIADVEGCQSFYGALTDPDDEILGWRETMLATELPKQVFAQGNTKLQNDGSVTLEEYASTAEGIVESWADRNV